MFRSYVAKLGGTKFDSVGVLLFAGQISTFYKQLRALKVAVPTFGTNFLKVKSEIQASEGTSEESCFSVSKFEPRIASDISRRFKTKVSWRSERQPMKWQLRSASYSTRLRR